MRRLRHRTSFGPVSQRERRNADLFFADLIGGGVAGAAVLRENADLFFEELVGFDVPDPSALSPSREAEAPPDAGRAPGVTDGANKDEIIVTRADGTRYHLRRKVRAQVFTRPGRPRAGFCSDDERVFFRIAWCEGTQGRIDAGANLQGAFKQLLDKVFDQISRGATPDQIKQTFENASVQTFLEFDITKVGSWKITGDVKLDINRTGITSTTAKLSADRGWIKLGVEYKDSPDGKQVLGTVTIPLGQPKVAGKDCPVRELVVWWDVECLREEPITVTIKPPVPIIEKQEQLFLYFDHAKDTLRRDLTPGRPTPTDEIDAILRSEPKTGTARLNKRALERLDYLVGQGYWLISVAGYTSPEGRREKPKTGVRGTWEGNDALSNKRAEKVRKLIETRYRPAMWSPGMPPFMRFPADQTMPTGVGKSENPRLDDRFGKELEGAALDRAVILGDQARGLKPFLEQHPEESSRMTAEDRQFVADAKNSPRNRAERLFENLRRVEIHLRHRERLRDTPVTLYNLRHVDSCPNDLVEAAERKWGSRIPFIKRDPPLCK